MQNLTATVSRAGIAFILMLLTPLTFSASDSAPVVTENAACAAKEEGPACVPEVDAICSYKGTSTYDHYLDD